MANRAIQLIYRRSANAVLYFYLLGVVAGIAGGNFLFLRGEGSPLSVGFIALNLIAALMLWAGIIAARRNPGVKISCDGSACTLETSFLFFSKMVVLDGASVAKFSVIEEVPEGGPVFSLKYRDRSPINVASFRRAGDLVALVDRLKTCGGPDLSSAVVALSGSSDAG